jgi:hypothetical protein
MESHSNSKSLDVRDDETRRANPRPRMPGWARFTLGVSSQKKIISLSETLMPWVILSSFDGSAGDEGYRPKDKSWKMRKDSRALGVSLLGFSYRSFGQQETLFYFRYAKGLIPNPPTVITTKTIRGQDALSILSATGSLEPSLLVSPHLGGHIGIHLLACSSPAPTQIKLQPAPALLGQESVHTMLSITHH